MSLGLVNAERRRERPRGRIGTIQSDDTPPVVVAPSTRVIRLRSMTYRSRMACASCFSCGAILTCCSALSVLSVGSVLSVLSIGSTLSVLSVASVNSRMSIGSNGCAFKMFADCANRQPDDGLELDVIIEPDTWDFMAMCDFNDYQRFKTYEPADTVSPCDYRPARCEYRGRNGFKNGRDCKVRRKGFSTWRNMGDGPSLKIKFEKDESGSKDFDFGDVGRQQFEADKVTINNMGFSDAWNGYDEVDAYDTFYRLQGPRTPIAARIKTRAFRGSDVQWDAVHALVEDVSNDDYFKRIHADDLLLYEADNRGTEIKDVEGAWEDATIDGSHLKDLVNRPSDLHEFMQPDEILSYYVAEKLVHNWDGGLLINQPRNFYLLAEGSDATNPRVRYVPKGLDWVFQGCIYELYTDGGRPYDGPTQYAIETHPDVLAQLERDAATTVPYASMTCGQEIGIAILIIVVSTAIACLLLACALLSGRAWRALRRVRFT